MLAQAETSLTLAGFIGLAALGLSAIGLGVSTATKNSELRERIVKLETMLEAHLKNGARHEGKE